MVGQISQKEELAVCAICGILCVICEKYNFSNFCAKDMEIEKEKILLLQTQICGLLAQLV